MLDVLQSLGSLAHSANETVTIAVPADIRALGVRVAAEYPAVAGTSGIEVSFQVSPDGENWSASKVLGSTIAPAAGVIGSAEYLFSFQDDPYKADAQPVVAIKVSLTNLDGTNAATVCVESEDKTVFGR